MKAILKRCVFCRRYNNRTIKLNQSPYRLFRLEPKEKAFSTVFLDYLGPYYVELNSVKSKVWVLCITCLYTRAVNLQVSLNMSNDQFIRSLQLHTFKFGLPSLILSDLGSQIVSSAEIITEFLSDENTRKYFSEFGISTVKFDQYFKGCHQLGGLVEICVKMTKRLLAASIKDILDFHDFEFFLMESDHLINQRPIAFKESLRDSETDVNLLPKPITPEALIHGYDLNSVNIIPSLHFVSTSDFEVDHDFDPVLFIRKLDNKLCKVRKNLNDIYHDEFLRNLLEQSVDRGSRFKKVTHNIIEPGDIVLIKDEFKKPNQYVMARVESVQLNDLGESTGALLVKSNRERVKRHASSIVPLLKLSEYTNSCLPADEESAAVDVPDSPDPPRRCRRAAAVISDNRTKAILQHS